jgi:hypothetical protein
MVHFQAELMCDVFEFVCVKKRLVIRISQFGTSIKTAMSNAMTYASLAAPVHASWGIDMYKFRDDMVSLNKRHTFNNM